MTGTMAPPRPADARPAGKIAEPDYFKPNHAFGVDPVRRERFSLRQARYDAAAEDIDRWAGEAAAKGHALRVLDIGCKTGTMLRHLEHRPNFKHIRIDGTDIGEYEVYGRHLYGQVTISNLMLGQPEIASGTYDVVVCEQVLEHLARIELAIASLERVLKPGGKLIVGVPIFVPALAFLRRQYVAATLRQNPERYWSHIQSFSQRSFERAMQQHSNLVRRHVRGFRIASEGLIMPLENYRWWWKFNRELGERVPSLCTEIQSIYEKPTI